MVTPLVMGMVVACSMILLLLICCWCLSCTRCRWWFTLPMARSRREKERRRKALTAKLAVERGRDTLRSTLARRPRSRCWRILCWWWKLSIEPCHQVCEGEEGSQPSPVQANHQTKGSRCSSVLTLQPTHTTY